MATRVVAGSLILSAVIADARNPAYAAGTLAGTSIINVATATYIDEASTLQAITSNNIIIRVDEVLDVVVSPIGVQPFAVVPGDPEYRLTFRVTNSGNGPEGFTFLANTALGGDQFDPTLIRVVVDSDGDGIYDPLIDSIFAPGSEPVLAADSSINIFVFTALPGGATTGDEGYIGLTASAMSGSGVAGSLLPGLGTGGSDAVVGNTTGAATAAGRLLIAGAQPTMVKAQSLSGSGQPAAGTIITYTISADLGGTGAASPVIADLIPAGTRYVPGSLTLGGAPLSDGADADAGMFTGSGVEVALLGSFSGPQIITFRVEII